MKDYWILTIVVVSSIFIGLALHFYQKSIQLEDLAGQLSDIIRMHKDHECPTLSEDIDCILEEDTIRLKKHVYCY